MADEIKDSEKVVDGQSFYNEALTGSGLLNERGEYGPSRPDPTVLRGGPKGARRSPGGVERPAPETLTPPVPRARGGKSTGSKAQ